MNWIGIYVTLFCWFYLNQLATAADKLAQAITYGANKRLLKDLFLNNPQTNLIRGVEKFSENVTVRIGISLMNILDVNFKEHSLTSNVWVNLLWTDPSISWDYSRYNDITEQAVPVSMIWSPDVLFYNELTDQQSLSKSETALLNYNGDVTWLSPKVLKTYCYLEEKASIHKCEIRVGPGIHSKQVDFQSKEVISANKSAIDVSNYLNGRNWEIISTNVTKNNCCDPFVGLTFTLSFAPAKIDRCS